MKKYILYLATILILCFAATAWALNIDTDSNDSVDAPFGGTNRTSACSNGELLVSDGTDYDCLGATPAGDLGGTWANPSVDDDSHDHVPGNIDLNEGQIIVGNGSSVGEATSTIPNLAYSAFPSTDDTWSGIGISGTAGYATSQWDVVFLDPVSDNNKFEKADADSSGDFPAWGLATGAVAEDAALVVIVKGCIRNDGWNGSFTHGDLLYLDETTAGGLTATAPSTSTDCVQPIGRFFDLGTDTYLCVDVNPVSGWATVP